MELPVADGKIQIKYRDDIDDARVIPFKDIRNYQVRDNHFFIAFSAPELTHASKMEYIPFTSVQDFIVYPNSDMYLKALEEYQEQCAHDWLGIPSNSPFNPDCRVCNICELAEPIMPPDPSERTET